MAKLVPVSGNPFEQNTGPKLTPVSGNPFLPQEKKDERLTWRDTFVNAAKNVPQSAKEYATNMYQALRHPVDTGEAIGHLFAGIVQKIAPGVQEDEKYANAFAGAMMARYGSVDDFKKTLSQDPVGVITDVASLLMAGGAAVKGVGAGTKVGKAGAAIEKFGAGLDPLNIHKKIIMNPVAKTIIRERLPKKLYESGIKFSTTLSRQQKDKLINLGLQEGITPNVKGLTNLRDKIDILNNEIDSLIDTAQQTGRTIPITRLFDGFDDLIDNATLSSKPQTNINNILNIKKQITSVNKKLARSELTPKEAQKLKRTIYRDLQSYYGKVKNSPASVEAQQKVAMNAKMALEEIVPDIKAVNRRDGDLIELYDAIERASSRIQNRDLIGIGAPIKGTMGGVFAGPGGAAVGVGLGILDRPVVKSMIAIKLNKLRRKGYNIRNVPAAFRLGAVKSGETYYNIEDQINKIGKEQYK